MLATLPCKLRLEVNSREFAIWIILLSSQMYTDFFSSFHLKVNPEGGLIAVGFEDGVVRIIEVYDPKLLPSCEGQAKETAEINLKQVFKPHTAAVTALAYEQKGDVFATGVCII